VLTEFLFFFSDLATDVTQTSEISRNCAREINMEFSKLMFPNYVEIRWYCSFIIPKRMTFIGYSLIIHLSFFL
jgi:hypothetical protein